MFRFVFWRGPRVSSALLLVLLLAAATAASGAALGPGIKSPVVQRLARILQADPQLAASVRYTLAHVPKKDWVVDSRSGRNLTALLEFFDEWAHALVVPRSEHDRDRSISTLRATPQHFPRPLDSTTPTPLSFVSPMWSLASETRDSVWLRDPNLLQWLTEFMNVRGAFMDSNASWTSGVAKAWWNVVNRSDYQVPEKGFSNFNAFFTRQVRPQARPVDSSGSSVTSPADGYIWLASANVTAASSFNLKADTLDPERLLGYNAKYSRLFVSGGGMAVVNFLAATNYHHFWSPVDGRIVAAEQLAGLYVAGGDPCCVGDHRRAYVIIESEAFGTVACVFVGMYDISNIVFAENVVVGAAVRKGEELGMFRYGGSEIVTLFEPGRVTLDEDVVKGGSWGGSTRNVGEKFGVRRLPRVFGVE